MSEFFTLWDADYNDRLLDEMMYDDYKSMYLKENKIKEKKNEISKSSTDKKKRLIKKRKKKKVYTKKQCVCCNDDAGYLLYHKCKLCSKYSCEWCNEPCYRCNRNLCNGCSNKCDLCHENLCNRHYFQCGSEKCKLKEKPNNICYLCAIRVGSIFICDECTTEKNETI